MLNQPPTEKITVWECDIAIIGGGLGGVAAALAAAEEGKYVILTEETDWIGGQVTSQAVSALDEHHYIEQFGGTHAYNQFRVGVRALYRSRYPEMQVSKAEGGGDLPINPGNGWVSRLCFEPRAGLEVLQAMLAPHVASGRLKILLQHTPAAVELHNGKVSAVRLAGLQHTTTLIHAAYFLDATEQGDVLPMANVPYTTGAEAVEDTGEPHASVEGPQPKRVQSFTSCFLVEYCPGEDHTIRKPRGYEYYRENQPFTLVLRQRGGRYRRFKMFDGDLPFWNYRQVFDAGALLPGAFADAQRPSAARSIALINWDANDYYKETLIDRSPAQQARITRAAKNLSLSFLYWLQTEAPHDDDQGQGYPGIRLMPEAVGTPDGLAKRPYIRESRRMIGLRRVLEQDISAPTQPDEQIMHGARAAHFADSVGIGWYPIDLHRCAGDPSAGKETRLEFDSSLPFQIPLGAMLSPAVDNLIAAAKNISTTHITNGAYRLHPVEWAIGEAAGTLAAFCIARSSSPRAVWEHPALLHTFQNALLKRGAPLVWTTDMGIEDPDFAILQSCLLPAPCAIRPGAPLSRGIFSFDSPRRTRLEILPDALLSNTEAIWLIQRQARACDNAALENILRRWQNASPGPLHGADWEAACRTLNLPAPLSADYPTLRQVCRQLALAQEST